MQILDLNVSVYHERPNKYELARLSDVYIITEKESIKTTGKLIHGNVEKLIDYKGTIALQDFDNALTINLPNTIHVSYDESKKLVTIFSHGMKISTFISRLE